MNDYKFFTAFFAVSILLVPMIFAAPAGETSVTISSGDTGGAIGATTALKANGASCSAASECTGGYCNSGVCASSAPAAASSSSSSSSSTTTTTSSATTTTTETKTETPATTTTTTTTTPPAETPKTTVTSVSVPVTVAEEKNKVVAPIKPADLGVAEIKPENVEVTKTGVAEIVTTSQAPILEKAVENVLPTATEEPAKQVLNEIKQAVSSGSSAPVSVSTTVEVFEVKEKTTGQVAYASKITLTLKPEKDLHDVKIVEVIPKSVAASILDVIFLGEKPKILQADPIVQWEFPEVKKDETKDLSYRVAKKIETVETNTVAVASVPTVAEPAGGTSFVIYLMLIGAAGAAVGYFAYRKMLHKLKAGR